jgi:hypothetical protein
MLRYDPGSDLGKVPGSDSNKESGTISGKNLGKCPSKKSGKKLPNRVKNLGKEAGQDKNMRDKETSLLRVRDIFVPRNIEFIEGQFNKEIKLNPSQIKRVSLS